MFGANGIGYMHRQQVLNSIKVFFFLSGKWLKKNRMKKSGQFGRLAKMTNHMAAMNEIAFRNRQNVNRMLCTMSGRHKNGK